MVLGPEPVDVGCAQSRHGDDDGLAVVDGEHGVFDQNPNDFAGVASGRWLVRPGSNRSQPLRRSRGRCP